MQQADCRKYLIIVPHPDDEINVAGQLIYRLTRFKNEVYVLFTTNGDYFAGEGEERLKEAIHALKILGIEEKNILFMGYGDSWKGEKHLYNTDGDLPLESAGGHRQTYGLENHPDYRFRKSGFHHTYTRKNYKKDLTDIILDLMADVLVAVDFDLHPDHRCTSLMFEEVLGEILKAKGDYHPIVLKKFAYAGVWNGPMDYYAIPRKPTCPPQKELRNDGRFDLDVPAYSWEERIRFSVSKETQTLPLCRNVIFQAEREYKTQAAKWRAGRICSADIVYWFRSTNSLSYQAKIEVSSGNPDFLNDFKFIDCPDIATKQRGIGIFGNCVWVPDPSDSVKSIKFSFQKPVNISCLCLYENFSLDGHIENGVVLFDNRFRVETGPLNSSGEKTVIEFGTQRGIHSFLFQITKFTGARPGLTEFEVFEKKDDIDLSYISEPYSPEKNSKKCGLCCFAAALHFSFETEHFFFRVKERIRRDFKKLLKSGQRR